MKKSDKLAAEAANLVSTHGSINKAAAASGIARSTLQYRYNKAVEKGLADQRDKSQSKEEILIAGRLRARQTPRVRGRRKRRFIVTCAQNNTELHEAAWNNLLALADHYDAQVLVARTVYERFAEAAHMDKKLILDRMGAKKPARRYWWDERVQEYFHDERLELAPGLVWCGELNIIPTAAQPLTGLEGYTGRNSSIVPHPRFAVRSVASHAGEGTKLLYTTGTVTKRNYIQRKAGMLADFHHCYGGLIVEVDKDGTWFVRQLNADSEGTIYDLDLRVHNGRVRKGVRLKGITWGDIHVAYGDPVAYKLAWGKGGILDTLRPEHQFMHDLIDFRARNGHNIKRGLHGQAFLEYVKGFNSVEAEMNQTAEFLSRATRPWCETVVVDSNHDNFLVEWIEKLGDFRRDPVNAVYFLKAALHYWQEMEAAGAAPNMTRWAIGQLLRTNTGPVRFLDEDESFILCPDAHGGIECGLHGHEGINGARATPRAFSKTGRKANVGHHHSAGIFDGLYVAGIMGSLDQGYNKGLGSWSQTNIYVYENGKRTLATIYDGKWRVE